MWKSSGSVPVHYLVIRCPHSIHSDPRASARRGTVTLDRRHFLMYQNESSLTYYHKAIWHIQWTANYRSLTNIRFMRAILYHTDQTAKL